MGGAVREKIMKILDEKKYLDWKNVNTDPYGDCIFRFAENWAERMETEIDNGAKIYDIAEKTSQKADDDCGGITGFMYGAAVNILSKCWIHGEALKKWHNKKYDYDGEGVVNPAIIHVGKKQ